MGELNFCVLADITKAVYEQILNDLSTDTGVPYLVSRMLHNKLVQYPFQFGRCYLLYFDTKQLTVFTQIFLLPLVLYAFIEKSGRKILIVIQLFMPLFFIFNLLDLNLGARIEAFRWYYIGLALIGGIKLIYRLITRLGRTRKRRET